MAAVRRTPKPVPAASGHRGTPRGESAAARWVGIAVLVLFYGAVAVIPVGLLLLAVFGFIFHPPK